MRKSELDDLEAINAAIEVGDWAKVQRRASAMGYENGSSESSSASDISTNATEYNSLSTVTGGSASQTPLQSFQTSESSSVMSSVNSMSDGNLDDVRNFVENEDWEGLIQYTSSRNIQNDDFSSSSSD